MGKLFKDILRDKGSVKYSITKFLALITFFFLIGYLSFYLLWLEHEVDHTLIIELMGMILTLVGLKNNWGIKSNSSVQEPKTTLLLETKKDNKSDDDESVF